MSDMFKDIAGPRVFAAPPGADFAATFATGLRRRLPEAAPEELARTTVVVNTRRTARAMTSAFEARLIERAAEWLAMWKSPGDHKATAFILFGMLEGSIHSHVLGHAQVSDERFTRTLVESLVRVARPDLYQPTPRQ